MLRCAWCMKKISHKKPVYGLSVKFSEGVDYSVSEGKMIQIDLSTRNTSVPIIITATRSEAKKQGVDGIFAICSEKCGDKMKDTITKEINIFKEFMDIRL